LKNNIPKIIHLLCKDKQMSSPNLIQVRMLHPDWSICLYDDTDIQNIMKSEFPVFIDRFNSFQTSIQRIDIFRMFIVYLHGGFYLDMDVFLMKPLDDLLDNGIVFSEEKTLTAYEMQLSHHKYDVRIANYMFGGARKHPLLLHFALLALSNYSKPVLQENDILETTGPGLLTNFYHEQKEDYEGILLLKNNTLNCVKNCAGQPSCHFGDYARHYHNGSWRWENKTTINDTKNITSDLER
jgi:mannosyltransferase OCH1-like enzyme